MTNEQVEQMVTVLNEAFKADPVAILSILGYQIPVNQELANHPTIQCRAVANGAVTSLLGLLNGVIGESEVFIATAWTDKPVKPDGSYEMLGFRTILRSEVLPPEPD